MPSRVSHVCSLCEIRVRVKNILLILLRNTHVGRYDPADPAHPAPAAAHPGTLTAARLKITTALDATELLAITAPEGKPRVDRAVTAGIVAKSLGRVRTAIREACERARPARAPRCRRHDCRSRRPQGSAEGGNTSRQPHDASQRSMIGGRHSV